MLWKTGEAVNCKNDFWPVNWRTAIYSNVLVMKCNEVFRCAPCMSVAEQSQNRKMTNKRQGSTQQIKYTTKQFEPILNLLRYKSKNIIMLKFDLRKALWPWASGQKLKKTRLCNSNDGIICTKTIAIIWWLLMLLKKDWKQLIWKLFANKFGK